MDIKKVISDLKIEPDKIADQNLKTAVIVLLNLVEACVATVDELKAENQTLKDEINRLKGEQGKPNIRKQKTGSGDISSERERKQRKKKKSKKSKAKKAKLKIHETRICSVGLTQLPEDAVFKGYDSTIIQDILITPNNIEFKKAIYYSPSTRKTYRGQLPAGYYGEFGPGVKSLILQLYNASNMSEPAIVDLLLSFDIHISPATISRILTDNQEEFHQEKVDIVSAGMASTDYQQIDDTGARVNGINHYTHILCNPFYTAYFTLPKKERLSIIEMLSGGESNFYMDDKACEWMVKMRLSAKQLVRVKTCLSSKLSSKLLTRKQIDDQLALWFPNPKKQAINRRIILESCALSAYHKRDDAIKILICDDAPQFKLIAHNIGLCWVHEGRHYKKLNPFIPIHRKIVDNFLTEFWDYYQQLFEYKASPELTKARILETKFMQLFSAKTGYDKLDEQLSKTLSKKEELLLVLSQPDIPLHNNDSELGARVQARKRDVSLQTKNKKGTDAKDTFMTIVQTAKKLGVNIHQYLFDRISKKHEMPALAQIIRGKNQRFLGLQRSCA